MTDGGRRYADRVGHMLEATGHDRSGSVVTMAGIRSIGRFNSRPGMGNPYWSCHRPPSPTDAYGAQ